MDTVWLQSLKEETRKKAKSLGCLDITIAATVISDEAKEKYQQWLNEELHGSMDYLARNTELRFNPILIHENTVTIICVKIPYLTHPIKFHKERLNNQEVAYVSSYALGRDYHKVVKQILNNLAVFINEQLENSGIEHKYRAFTDSAPVMEVQLSSQSGLGWRGKNTLLITKDRGSMFFLGELFTNLPLPIDKEISNHCGSCNKCIDICPTKAFVTPYKLDARRCISYLTIENKGAIPLGLRKLIGNRIYGCDDCQLFCPWNKFSQQSPIDDFNTRNHLDSSSLLELFKWNEEEFLKKTEGSAIRRIGYNSWIRNLAVAIGNSEPSLEKIKVLQDKLPYPDKMVTEHIIWAINELTDRLTTD